MAAASFRPSMEPGIWIGENDSYVETVFKDEDCFVGVCFNNIELGGPDHIDGVHADQKLVLNDQDDRPLSFYPPR
jgi:hypothetical protein